MKNYPKLDEIDNPSEEQFINNYVLKHKPVLIKNGASMAALEKWDGEYIRSKIGSKKAHCLSKKEGKYTRAHMKTMSVSEFVDYMDGCESDDERYYLRASIKEEYPELLDDIVEPSLITRDKNTEINIWYGWGGNKAPLHYDAKNNFLVQIKGKKKLLLFPASERKNLYPNNMFHDFSHFSRADITPDLSVDEIHVQNNKLGRVRNAKGYQVELAPGDMLYMPAFCWHSALGFGENIALNFWWGYSFSNDYLPHLNYVAHHPGFVWATIKKMLSGKSK